MSSQTMEKLPSSVSCSAPILLVVKRDKVLPITADYLRLLFNEVFRVAGLKGVVTPHTVYAGGGGGVM